MRIRLSRNLSWVSAAATTVALLSAAIIPHAAFAQATNAAASNSAASGFGFILEPIVSLFSLLVYVSAAMLNASVYYSIIKMGAIVGHASALQTAWATFRDLGNLALLFGFVFIGIKTILDSDTHATRVKIATLIVVAVTINFSSLAARAIIDTGNIISVQFYQAYNGGTLPVDGNFTDAGVANKFLDAVHLAGLYNQQGVAAGAASGSNYILVAFLSIILFTVASFVFFSLAFLFVSRLVILILLITISPLAFAAFVVPGFDKKGREWMQALLNNTFVAPITLLLLLISINMVTTLRATLVPAGNTDFNNLYGAAWPGMILTFAIISGFFIASLLIAKQMSAFGASMAISFGRKATALPFLLPARSAQRGISKFSNTRIGGLARAWIPGAQGALNAAANAKIGGFQSAGERDKELLGIKHDVDAATSAAKAKRDLRNAEAAERAAKAKRDAAISQPGATQAQKDLAEQEYQKAREGYEAVLQKTNIKDLEEAIKTASDDQIAAMGRALSPDKFAQLMKSDKIDHDKQHDLQHARFEGLTASTAKNYSSKDLEVYAKSEPEKFNSLADAGAFSPDQTEALAKSGELTDSQRKRVRSSTGTGKVETQASAGAGAAAGSEAAKLGASQKTKLSRGTLTTPEVIDTFGPADFAALEKDGKLSDADMATIVTRAKDPANGMNAAQRTRITNYFTQNPNAASIWGW